jgi:hypothetical protein
MDALGGAFARFQWASDGNGRRFLQHTPGAVANKMNQNGTVYAAGYQTGDDSWLNLARFNQNTSFGWSDQVEGRGVATFGRMLADSQAFSACMAKRAFTEVCRRDPLPEEGPVIEDLASDFRQSGYKFRRLLMRAAIRPECLGK